MVYMNHSKRFYCYLSSKPVYKSSLSLDDSVSALDVSVFEEIKDFLEDSSLSKLDLFSSSFEK